jgi:hypothetical protein
LATLDPEDRRHVDAGALGEFLGGPAEKGAGRSDLWAE